jgi:hypothetical protein
MCWDKYLLVQLKFFIYVSLQQNESKSNRLEMVWSKLMLTTQVV